MIVVVVIEKIQTSQNKEQNAHTTTQRNALYTPSGEIMGMLGKKRLETS